MRTLFIIPLVLMSLVSFPSWGLTMGDLVEREGVYYKKFTDVPFTGDVKSNRATGSFKNGIRDGYWIWYYKDGQLWAKGSFKNGEKDGPWITYYPKGHLKEKGTWVNGKREGYFINHNFHDNSIVEDETGTFKNGVKISD